MLFAPGMCPPRWHVSGSPGGARISPVNSAGLRTSTSPPFFSAAPPHPPRSTPRTRGDLRPERTTPFPHRLGRCGRSRLSRVGPPNPSSREHQPRLSPLLPVKAPHHIWTRSAAHAFRKGFVRSRRALGPPLYVG